MRSSPAVASICDVAGICRECTYSPEQAATECGYRDRDRTSHEGCPCDLSRDSTALSKRRPRPDPPRRGPRQPSVAGICPLSSRLFPPIRDRGQHRVAVIVRGVLLVSNRSAGGAVLPGRHDPGG